ncbi:MAG: acyl-CoA thioesterase [Gaiellaceae bacterium]
MSDEYSFSTEVRVRFAETDAQGIAHHAAYLVWFEVTRVDYLDRFDGGYPGFQARGFEALTIEAHARYLAPARFDERLTVHARCVDLRGSRFRFEYLVTRGDEPVADGWTGHACVAAESYRPTRLPAYLVDAIRAAESATAS